MLYLHKGSSGSTICVYDDEDCTFEINIPSKEFGRYIIETGETVGEVYWTGERTGTPGHLRSVKATKYHHPKLRGVISINNFGDIVHFQSCDSFFYTRGNCIRVADQLYATRRGINDIGSAPKYDLVIHKMTTNKGAGYLETKDGVVCLRCDGVIFPLYVKNNTWTVYSSDLTNNPSDLCKALHPGDMLDELLPFLTPEVKKRMMLKV